MTIKKKNKKKNILNFFFFNKFQFVLLLQETLFVRLRFCRWCSSMIVNLPNQSNDVETFWGLYPQLK